MRHSSRTGCFPSLMGEPADVANCVRAACSGMLDYTTGQVLNADGGFHLRRL